MIKRPITKKTTNTIRIIVTEDGNQISVDTSTSKNDMWNIIKGIFADHPKAEIDVNASKPITRTGDVNMKLVLQHTSKGKTQMKNVLR